MNYLYSLYDALVSINVSSERARAVVDAMERDMGTTLATKQDLDILRRDLKSRFELVDQKIENLRTKLESKIDGLEHRMTIKLGSMMIVGVASPSRCCGSGAESLHWRPMTATNPSSAPGNAPCHPARRIRLDIHPGLGAGGLIPLALGLIVSYALAPVVDRLDKLPIPEGCPPPYCCWPS